MDIEKALKSRRSINFFDQNHTISDEEINSILELANYTPSSMNLQPWKIIVVKSFDIKNKLREACFNQSKVSEASCNFVVVADPHALEENIDDVLKSWVDLGYITEETASNYKNMALGLYETQDSLKRKIFAVKNSSFYAMSLMYAAMAIGYETHPMDGFDENKVKTLLNLPEYVIIPVIIACGKFKKDAVLLPRAFRRNVEKFSKII
ncbi:MULTISPECIES: nitroreductase family protein [Calditerrivibrio]|uniref:nitroreductase family protein n=1 Tax=Calditerrivibrio TaxID=545865 RepID=UPI003C7654C8